MNDGQKYKLNEVDRAQIFDAIRQLNESDARSMFLRVCLLEYNAGKIDASQDVNNIVERVIDNAINRLTQKHAITRVSQDRAIAALSELSAAEKKQ